MILTLKLQFPRKNVDRSLTSVLFNYSEDYQSSYFHMKKALNLRQCPHTYTSNVFAAWSPKLAEGKIYEF